MSSCFFTSLCFFLFAFSASSSSSSSTTHTSYTTIPGASSTISDDELYSTLSFVTSYYTGGERLFGELPNNTAYNNFVKKVSLQIQRHRKTNATDVYEVKGYFLIQFPYWYGGDPSQNDHDYPRSSDRGKTPGVVRFFLKGLWSEKSRQLLMVGSASWAVEGKPLVLEAVLDLNYTVKNNPTLYTSYISGTLKSMVSENHPGYFDPLSIFSFPTLPNYSYSLLPLAFGSAFTNDFADQEKEWPSYEGYKYCWVIVGESVVFDLEYAEECSECHHCSPFGFGDGLLPRFMFLNLIQCSPAKRKLRYMAKFQNSTYDQGFGLNSTVIGEASWDDEKKEFTSIACKLLDPLSRSANEVGDCTMRLSLKYTSVFTVNNEPKLVGQFRSTTNASKSGYFRKINLTNFDGYGLVTLPEVRYEYKELDRVRKSCSAKRYVKKGNTYPNVESDSMRLDLTVENPRGEQFAWAYAAPLSINGLYQKKSLISHSEEAEISYYSNISYKISLNSPPEVKSSYRFDHLNLLANPHNEVEITAEGVYNAETGYLCMVGCRKLVQYVKNSTQTSMDCEILVTVEFSPVTRERGVLSNGTIVSKRAETDPLYFDDMIILSDSYDQQEAAQTIWRMNLEIAMVLISNTLTCIFVALQIFHVRRNPEVPSFVSLVMLLILSVGHVIPLALNFQAVYPIIYATEDSEEYMGSGPSGGRLEANEVAVRLSSLVAFVLLMRLLQLVWSAKQDKSDDEKAGYVMLSLYVAGGLFGLLFNSKTNLNVRGGEIIYIVHQQDTVWGCLKSSSGLILDSFLLPQILINGLRGLSLSEKALSSSFYIGISAVRLAPHVYNQYRVHNYPVVDVKNTYYYANPALGFSPTAWDFMISFWIVVLAVILFLQQRRGGRFLLKV